jgi:hypothetical protein
MIPVCEDFQTKCCVYSTSSLFLDVTQRWMVVADVSGQTIGPIFKGQAVQDGTERSYWNVGSLTTKQRRVTSQKSEHLIYTAAEA